MSSNTAPVPGEGMWSDQQPPDGESARAREVFENLMCEDGLLGTLEILLSGLEVAGTDPVTLQLEGMKLLAADLARRMNQADPFAVPQHDAWFDPADVPGRESIAAPTATDDDHGAVPGDGEEPAGVPEAWRVADEAAARLARFEDVTVLAHQLMNQAGAVRTYAAERCARFDTAPDSGSWSAADCLAGQAPRPGDVTEHAPGHRGRFAGDLLGPSLGLGPQAADSMVDEAVWLTQRVPAVLAEVARGEANLATAAAIAREVQDARPETCELVEEAVLGRGVHRRSAAQARRSARTMVEQFEATAARTTLRRTQAQHTGVWLDPHSTPGLSALTAVMPTGQAATVMDAVDQRARAAQHEAKTSDGSGQVLLLGQHRANALHDLALSNVELVAHLELIVPPATSPPESPTPPHASGPPEDGDGPPPPPEGSGPPEGGDGPPPPPGGNAPPTVDPPQHRHDDGCPVSPPELRATRSTVTPDEAAEILTNAATVVVHDRAGPVPADQVIQLLAQRASRITVERFDPHALAQDPIADPAATAESATDPPSTTESATGPPTTTVSATPDRTASPPGVPRDRYRPGARLRRAVKRRDRTCRYPGCDRRAIFTDLDHVEPWPRGRTRASNLQNLCRHHHCTKHQAGWHVTMTPDGTCTWTSPTGRTHVTRPGLLELLDDLAYVAGLSR